MISSYQEIFYKHWNILSSHKKLLNSFDLNNAFNENKERFKLFSTEHDGLFLDYSKHLITTETIFKLTAFAQEIQLQKAIKKLFDSSDDNSFPKHINLRNPKDSTHTSTAQHIKNLTDAIHNGSWLGYTGKKITDVVTIGVGGAFFGPKLISSALTSYAQKHIKCHYLSDLDNSIRLKLLSTINAETTLFIVISKSFSTIEVLENIKVIRMWYLSKGVSIKQQQKHFIALSTKQETSAILNIQKENTYYLPKDIPGRYSVWSIAGLPLALYLGTDIFQQILDGAHSADKHFYQTSFTENIPVLMALLSFWYQNFWQSSSQAILPFNYHLRHLVPYLQQIDMESNGKSVQQNGLNTLCHTAPIIWGGLGYQVQHSYFQQLCQGTQVIPVDFI
ncbi:UNVERIFIED_CONTAM: hypothetical protein GTU68_045809, partial [Idotea baltica]|nr:hypothetical protein [Idotea baltica]